MRVLIVTKIYPNRVEPLSSPFNRLQFGELSRFCDVEILATIPWFPGARAFAHWSRAGRLVEVPSGECIDGLYVRHPRFALLPKIGPGLSGPLYAASLARIALEYQGRVDVVLGSWAYPDGFAAVKLAKWLGVPAVVKLHGSDMNVVAKLPGPRKRLAQALPDADRVVAVSRPLRDAAIELGVDPDRVDVVPNGIDRSRFHPRDQAAAREELGLSRERPMALYVGHVERHKGVMDLVRAAAELAKCRPQASVVVVGDGQDTRACRSLAESLGVNVRFVDARPHEEIPTWLAACDVLVLPSFFEGTPNVVLEALACGRRVVATAVGGVPDVVSSDLLGSLVSPHDPHALARAIEVALSSPYDPDAVSAALDRPSWSESARRLHDSLMTTLERRAREAA